MNGKTRVFENILYVSGLKKDNRNIEERSITQISEHVTGLCLKNSDGRYSILDIGCGTGRFAIPFALTDDRLCVTALDSSENMLQLLADSIRKREIENIEVVHQSFEKWRTTERYHVAFMSAVIHLMEDKSIAFHRVGNLQNPGDYFVLRTALRHQIKDVDVYKRVPEAVVIYEASHATYDEIQMMAKDSGYTIESNQPMIDTKYLTRDQFLDVFHMKKHSAFWEIPDRIYQDRLRAIENETREMSVVKCTSGTSLITMRKTKM